VCCYRAKCSSATGRPDSKQRVNSKFIVLSKSPESATAAEKYLVDSESMSSSGVVGECDVKRVVSCANKGYVKAGKLKDYSITLTLSSGEWLKIKVRIGGNCIVVTYFMISI
jgi:hypothetical protein